MRSFITAISQLRGLYGVKWENARKWWTEKYVDMIVVYCRALSQKPPEETEKPKNINQNSWTLGDNQTSNLPQKEERLQLTLKWNVW